MLLNEHPVLVGQLVSRGHGVAELGLPDLAGLDEHPPVAPEVPVKVVLPGELAVVTEVRHLLLGPQPAVQGELELARVAPPQVPSRVLGVAYLYGGANWE